MNNKWIGGLTNWHIPNSWWRHHMETFSALLAICVGNSPVPGEFPTQRPVTRSFDVFFDLRLNKRLSKQSWGWWFETPSWSLWRHGNVSLFDYWSSINMLCDICHCWWWRHHMETLIVQLALCEGSPQVASGFSHKRPVMGSPDDIFVVCPKQL